MDSIPTCEINHKIDAVDLLIQSREAGDANSKLEMICCITEYLNDTENRETGHLKTFVSLIEHEIGSDKRGRRLAQILLRMLSSRNSLPGSDEEPLLDRRIMDLFEQWATDLCREANIEKGEQTYKSIERLSSLHQRAIEPLDLLPKIGQDIRSIIGQKQGILKILNSRFAMAYLPIFGFKEVSTEIKGILLRMEELFASDTTGAAQHLENLCMLVSEKRSLAATRNNFLYKDFYLPFLTNIRAGLSLLEHEWQSKFDCRIEPINEGSFKAEKRYPLHEEGREIIVTIPMKNMGPGVAHEVKVIMSSGEEVAINSVESIGNINPGLFGFTFSMLILEAIKELNLEIEVQWTKYGQEDVQTKCFDCVIRAQNTDVPWEELVYASPYSTEIAEGDEFVGRKTLLYDISAKFLSEKVQSCFITGQKRIGKTSLAHAAVAYAIRKSSDAVIHQMYIDWGGFTADTGTMSIEILGHELSRFMNSIYPMPQEISDLRFFGSLQPLCRLADKLFENCPDKKFIFIIDEFDRMHTEMYHHGQLAESFFASLRTLSSKRNIAFLLVGGENMPFIMGQQGDQLNKFVQVKLDYFSRLDEYSDFKDLVRGPTESHIEWVDEAIEHLFQLTHGHPYYTKLICAEVFKWAVKTRDAEIISRDIERSLKLTIPRLASNSFQHLWMDGIPRTKENSHAIVADRLKLFAIISKILRMDRNVSTDLVSEQAYLFGLEKHNVRALMDDLCKRNILFMGEGHYQFVVPLFQYWLREVGPEELITDRITEDAARRIRESEDRDYVRDSELAELVESWGLYQSFGFDVVRVRQWLEQFKTNSDIRLMFKLLQNLRFLSESEIRAYLLQIHRFIREETPVHTTTRKGQKRGDILIVYLDGEGKSGQFLAGRYAEQNAIFSKCIINSRNFARDAEQFEQKEKITINGVVIIDDIVATGRTMSDLLDDFFSANRDFLVDRSISVVIVSLLATKVGEEAVESIIDKHPEIHAKFRYCEPIANKHYAFDDRPGIWATEEEFDRAKNICRVNGALCQKRAPLGVGDLGLLVTFPNTCPNNSLPILHGSSAGQNQWKPLFPRLKN